MPESDDTGFKPYDGPPTPAMVAHAAERALFAQASAVAPEEPLVMFFLVTTTADEFMASRFAAVHAHYLGLAALLVQSFKRSAERTVAIRKLLESRDAALRALVAP